MNRQQIVDILKTVNAFVGFACQFLAAVRVVLPPMISYLDTGS